MADFAGHVLLDEDRIGVVIDLTEDTISLTAGNANVGRWRAGECIVRPDGRGQWLISAEDDTLAFLPDDPTGFARTLNGSPPHPEWARGKHLKESLHQSPPPRTTTVMGFYALAAITAVLGIWALISLF